MSKQHPENIYHKSADGAGFGRLRAAQRQRELFAEICSRTHPSGRVYIDQVREYCGAQIVFYRVQNPKLPEQARCALFKLEKDEWRKENDIIVAMA